MLALFNPEIRQAAAVKGLILTLPVNPYLHGIITTVDLHDSPSFVNDCLYIRVENKWLSRGEQKGCAKWGGWGGDGVGGEGKGLSGGEERKFGWWGWGVGGGGTRSKNEVVTEKEKRQRQKRQPHMYVTAQTCQDNSVQLTDLNSIPALGIIIIMSCKLQPPPPPPSFQRLTSQEVQFLVGQSCVSLT